MGDYIYSYHTPSQAQSQSSRQGTYSLEYVEQAIERAIMTERAEWEAHFRAFESRVNARIFEPAVTQQTASDDRAFEPGLFRSLILRRYFLLSCVLILFVLPFSSSAEHVVNTPGEDLGHNLN